MDVIDVTCVFNGDILASSWSESEPNSQPNTKGLFALRNDKLVFYTNQAFVNLSWLRGYEIASLSIRGSKLAILTKAGYLFLLPLHIFEHATTRQSWEKFVSSDFFSIQRTQENLLEGFLNSLGFGQQPTYELETEISCMILKSAEDFTCVVWKDENVVAGSKTGEIFCINSHNLKTEYIEVVEYPIRTLLALTPTTHIAVGERASLLTQTATGVTVKTLPYEKHSAVSLQWFKGRQYVIVKTRTLLRMYSMDTPEELICSIDIDEKAVSTILFSNYVLGISELLISVLATHILRTREYSPKKFPRPSTTVTSSEKICICNSETCVQIFEPDDRNLDIADWMTYDETTSLISVKPGGFVVQAWTYVDEAGTLLISAESGVFQVTRRDIDIPGTLQTVCRTLDKKLYQRARLYCDTNGIASHDLIRSIELAPRDRLILELRYEVDLEKYLDYHDLHPILYNVLWQKLLSEKTVNTAYIVQLAYILAAVGDPTLTYLTFAESAEAPVLSMQTYDGKALFIATDKEQKVVQAIMKVLGRHNTNETRWFETNLWRFYNTLDSSVVLKLMILHEQLRLEKFSANDFLLYANQLSTCKLLRFLYKILDIGLLFENQNPLLTYSAAIQLLPVTRRTPNLHIRTNKIETGVWKAPPVKTWNISILQDRVESFVTDFNDYFKNQFCQDEYKTALTRILVLFVYTIASKERPGVSELVSSSFRYLIENLVSDYYYMDQVKSAAVALHSHLSLVVIYESQKEWVYALKARLLSETMNPVRCLLHYLHRVHREDQTSLLIYYTMVYWNRSETTDFLEAIRPHIKDHNILSLIEYVCKYT